MFTCSDTQSLDHLQNAANVLPAANRTHLLLRSYLLTLAAKKSDLLNYKQPNEDGSMCRKCCTKWQDQQYHMHVRPGKFMNRRARNIVKQSELKEDKLSKSHSILAKKYLKSVSSIAKIKCLICHNQKNAVLRKANKDTVHKKKLFEQSIDNDTGKTHIVSEELSTKGKGNKCTEPITPSAKSADIQGSASKSSLNLLIKHKKIVKPPQTTGLKSKLQPKPQKRLSVSAQKSVDAKQRNNMLLLANALKMKSASPAQPLRNLQSMLRK